VFSIQFAKDSLKEMQAQRQYERSARSRTVQLNQKKPEVRSEVCNLCSVVTETYVVLSFFGITQCCSYSKIKGVLINCNSAWRIPNKSSVNSRTHKLFVALPSKHATIYLCCAQSVAVRGGVRACGDEIRHCKC
jgi:hypothetical protein